MLKTSKILLSILLIFLMCACTNSLPIDNDEKTEQEENDYTGQQLNCSALKDIKSGVFIENSISNFYTNEGNIYQLSTQLFSNNTNCKKLNEDGIKVEKRLDNTSFIATDGYGYSVLDGKIIKGSKMNINDYEDTVIKKDFGVEDYKLKTDGKIYKHVDENWELYKEIDNEKIIDFYIESMLNIEYIKTDKAFYSLHAINKDQCEKFVDIECEYKLKKNEKLTSAYNDIAIILVSSSSVSYITKDGKIYVVNS